MLTCDFLLFSRLQESRPKILQNVWCANKAQNIAGYSWTLQVFVGFQRFVCSTSTWESYPSLLLFSDGLKAPTRRFPARNPQNLKNGYSKETIWCRSYAFVHPFSKIHRFQFTCQVSIGVPSLKITNRPWKTLVGRLHFLWRWPIFRKFCWSSEILHRPMYIIG